MQCPNIHHPSFKALVEKYGENLAYYYWALGEKNPLSVETERGNSSASFAVYNGPNLFKNAKKDLEDDGNYEFEGEKYTSVSNVIKTIQTRPYTVTDSYGQRAADKAWKYHNPEDELMFKELSIHPINKQQYQELMDKQYNMGIGKGLLLHAKIHNYVEKSEESARQVAEIKDEYGIDIEWLTNEKIRAIISKTGTDYYSDGATDKIHTEKVIGSTELGWFGTVDLLIDHGDDLYSLFDLKTGLRFNKIFEDSFFKYGRTSYGVDVFDTARNRAKLQIMLYALIIKAEHPNARFRNLDILYIKNQWSISEEDIYRKVNVPAFLEIIQRTLENEQPDIYNKLKSKPHFNKLFDPTTYTTYTSKDYDFMSDHPKSSSSDLVKHKLLKLQELIMFDSAMADLDRKTTRLVKTIKNGREVTIDETAERRQQIADLMAEIIELKKDPSISMSVTESNMGWLDRYLGSQSYSTNPYVQLYYKELSKAKQRSRDTYEKITNTHDSLLQKLIADKGLKAASRLIGGVDREKLFGNLFISDEAHKKRLMHSGDKEFNNLSKAEQNYLTFINNSMSGVFEKEHAKMIDPYNETPLANRIVTYRDWHGRTNIPVTNLDLHNKLYGPSSKEASPDSFKYYKGFFPRYAPQIDDVARLHGGFFTKAVVKYLWSRYTTNYFENEFDKWSNNDEAIPMKFLGSQEIEQNDNYTLNIELAYKSFMKHHIYKAQMDEVYAMAQAMRIYLDAQKEKMLLSNAGNTPPEHIERLIGWFEDSINLHILGRKSQDLTLSSRSSGKIVDNRYHKLNWAKVLRSLKSFFAGPTMWLKPLTGLPNFVFASLISIKEGIKTSLGISTSNAKFGLLDLASGFEEARKLLLWDARSNEAFRHNKTYLLMEKFGYLPDNHDWYTSNNEMLTSRNQLFTSKSMMLFHSLPEEMIATAIFVAQMKAMTFTNSEGKKMSMWDAYQDKKIKLEDGTEVTSIEWTGGKRGVRNVSNLADKPEYEEVHGMTVEEINAVKFLYEKIHGGYRRDERVAAEYYVMGELFLQMKKYMPAILKNVWASKGIRQTQGNLIEEIDENGNKVLKWKPQIIEGRYKILFGLLFNFLSIKTKTDGSKGNKIANLLGLQFDSTASWDKLSDAQKEDMKDFALTTSMYFLLLLGYMKLWDRGDDDTMKNIYKRIADDFAGNVNPMEILKNIKNSGIPTSINRGYQLLSGTTELFWSSLLYGAGYDDAALTKQGNFRGAAEVKRNLHFISAWYDWTSKMENSELYKEYMK